MVFLDHISNRLSTSLVKKEEDAMEEDEEDLFLASKIHLRLKMADSSCHKRNHKLALNILADIHKVRVFLRSWLFQVVQISQVRHTQLMLAESFILRYQWKKLKCSFIFETKGNFFFLFRIIETRKMRFWIWSGVICMPRLTSSVQCQLTRTGPMTSSLVLSQP